MCKRSQQNICTWYLKLKVEVKAFVGRNKLKRKKAFYKDNQSFINFIIGTVIVLAMFHIFKLSTQSSSQTRNGND